MSHHSSSVVESLYRPSALALIAMLGLGGAACAEDEASCADAAVDINGTYVDETGLLEFAMDHDCSTGTLSGIFYEDSFAHELSGSVAGEGFSFSATRELPSSGTDVWSSSQMDILSGGQMLRGQVLKNGAGGAMQRTFTRTGP